MLNCISNMDQLHDLISAFKAKHTKYHTNLLIPHDRLEDLVDNDRIRYFESNNCLSFIIKQYHSSMLYFYVNDLNNIETSFDEKPLFIELFVKPEKQEGWSRPFENKGFIKYSTYICMSATPQSILVPESIEDERFKIIPDTDMKYFKEILFANFDLVTDRLPEEWEYDDFFSRMYMFKAVDTESNKIPGFITYSIDNITSIGEYMHIDNDYRGLGLAKSLYSCYLKNTVDHVKRYINWVDQNNSVAISMYLSMGYKHDALRRELYIRN